MVDMMFGRIQHSAGYAFGRNCQLFFFHINYLSSQSIDDIMILLPLKRFVLVTLDSEFNDQV